MKQLLNSLETTPWRIVWNLARVLMVAAIVVATVEQVRLAVTLGAGAGTSPVDSAVKLFSFFTVQSNVIAAVVLAWAAVCGFKRKSVDSTALATALAAASTYMLITGIVYNLLLRGGGNADIMMGWSNNVHHIVGPIFLLLDVLLGPGRRALPWRAVLVVLAFPLLWVAVTLVRGPLISWYPYPFLDPATAGGYAGVAAWVLGISAAFTAVGFLVVAIGRWRGRTMEGYVRARDRDHLPA